MPPLIILLFEGRRRSSDNVAFYQLVREFPPRGQLKWHVRTSN